MCARRCTRRFVRLLQSGLGEITRAERLTLFQIVAAFPDGWLTSGQISREGETKCGRDDDTAKTNGYCLFVVSVMKKKYEKDSMEDV